MNQPKAENVRIIKKYSNRKLYDPTTKSYITLQGIKELLAEGSQVKIIDNKTGEDISRQTLAKILVEEEGRQTGAIPLGILRDMVVKSRDSVADYFKKTLQSGRDRSEEHTSELQSH